MSEIDSLPRRERGGRVELRCPNCGQFRPAFCLSMLPDAEAVTHGTPCACDGQRLATVDGQLVAHVAVSTRSRSEARACRLVVMPEWQGAGVGLRFLDAVCELWRTGANRYGRPMPTLFHTSHPGLASALRRSARWTQVAAKLLGDSKARSIASLQLSAARNGTGNTGTGYGGHFRAVQGFRYLGEQLCES